MITKRLGAANTGGHQNHNLEVPSVNNNFQPPHPVVDHKNIQNPQIAKPVRPQLNPNVGARDSLPRLHQNAVIPKDQENIQIAHPWAKRLRLVLFA